MTWDNILIGIVTGIVASIIIIMMQTTCDYLKRKKYETFRFYEFDLSDSWELSPAEYLRESGNQGSAKVKMELPFDMKSVQVFVKNELIYEDLDIPADSPIWICCDCSSSDLYNEVYNKSA